MGTVHFFIRLLLVLQIVQRSRNHIWCNSLALAVACERRVRHAQLHKWLPAVGIQYIEDTSVNATREFLFTIKLKKKNGFCSRLIGRFALARPRTVHSWTLAKALSVYYVYQIFNGIVLRNIPVNCKWLSGGFLFITATRAKTHVSIRVDTSFPTYTFMFQMNATAEGSYF